MATAKAVEAQGLAEAAAILKKAEAWREFDDAARLQTILEKLPAIIQSTAPALRAIAEPMSSIDKIVMIDHGGNGNGDAGKNGINRFIATTPTLIFDLLQQLQAMGLNLPDLLAQLGVKATPEQLKALAPNETQNGHERILDIDVETAQKK